MERYKELAALRCFTHDDMVQLAGSESSAVWQIKSYLQKGYIERVRRNLYAVISMETGLSVPDSDLLIKLAEILDVPVSRLLGSKIEAETKPDALAEQLSRINEQLAIKNRRAKRVWKVFAFIIGGIIVMYILGIIAFTSLTAHPAQSNTEETSQVIVGTETDT